MSNVYCTVCGSDFVRYRSDGKVVCMDCHFHGKPSRFKWIAELFFMLKIGKKNEN